MEVSLDHITLKRGPTNGIGPVGITEIDDDWQ